MNVFFRQQKILSRPALTLAFASTMALGFISTEAQAIPTGWLCVGSCGTSGANGVVTAPPNGNTTYDWISTNSAPSSSGLGLGSETNGSTLSSTVFSANVGQDVKFYFDYVTSDGAGFSDYAWAKLINLTAGTSNYLVTARTETTGSIIPGQGLPAVDATLTPSSVPIISGAPNWSPLGISSGACYSAGCGYTGWVSSDYVIKNAGTYQLQFGVVNWNDTGYDSGLAISGATIDSKPIDISTAVPEPTSVALLGLGLLGLAASRRKSAKSKNA